MFTSVLVFTLQSIKSRIETHHSSNHYSICHKFLLYSPLNQGLKHSEYSYGQNQFSPFLLYSPLNQGLKLDEKYFMEVPKKFLLYSPLNQGLKHKNRVLPIIVSCMFLLYSPLNQGLKLRAYYDAVVSNGVFLLYSPLNQGLKRGLLHRQ